MNIRRFSFHRGCEFWTLLNFCYNFLISETEEEEESDDEEDDDDEEEEAAVNAAASTSAAGTPATPQQFVSGAPRTPLANNLHVNVAASK